MKPTRLTEFMARMEPGSVAVFAGAPELRRNGDTDHEYRQDTDFYYLTRLNEPDRVAVSRPRTRSTSTSSSSARGTPSRRSGPGCGRASRGPSPGTGPTRPSRSAGSTRSCRNTSRGDSKLYYRLGHHEAFDHRLISALNRVREEVRKGTRGPDDDHRPGHRPPRDAPAEERGRPAQSARGDADQRRGPRRAPCRRAAPGCTSTSSRRSSNTSSAARARRRPATRRSSAPASTRRSSTTTPTTSGSRTATSC